MKKVRFGAGKYNGFGGKVDPSETIEQAAARELKEEVSITAKSMKKVAELTFNFPPEKESWNQVVHVYLVDKWEGEPTESEEMKPEWFPLNAIPYDKMWLDDKHWLPHVLSGKFVDGWFRFGSDGNTIAEMQVNPKSF